MDTTPALLSSKVKPIKEGRNVLSGEEQGETAVFASYTKISRTTEMSSWAN